MTIFAPQRVGQLAATTRQKVNAVFVVILKAGRVFK